MLKRRALQAVAAGTGLALPLALLLAAGSPALAASRATVVIPGNRFSPATVTVEAGGRVTWRNDDVVVHNAVAVNESFRTPMLQQGDSASVRFTKVGKVAYLCSIHPDMRGTVRVVAAGSPTSAPQAPDTGVADPAAEPAPSLAAGAAAAAGLAALTAAILALRRTRRAAG